MNNNQNENKNGKELIERCPWCGVDELYVKYHDEEWGVPEYCSHQLFEKLILDGFQAGLSWITILKKRDGFREAFHNFDAEKIALMTDNDVEALMNNTNIIRNRAKIINTIKSAQIFIDIEGKNKGGFAELIWKRVDGKPIINNFSDISQVPANTELSDGLSKELKDLGFKFVGSTIVYAFMQAVGVVNDHLVTCHRYEDCQKLANQS